MLLSCSESAATPPDDPGPAEQGDWQYHPGSCGRCQTGSMQDSQGDLGALLRSWRDRLSPVDVGLPAGDSRRAAGPPRPGDAPARPRPGLPALLARLGQTPLAVSTASWALVTWSPLWAALLGEP